jgi:hypothetical protein
MKKTIGLTESDLKRIVKPLHLIECNIKWRVIISNKNFLEKFDILGNKVYFFKKITYGKLQPIIYVS